jgi:O-acetyl-ADP-ribose deacetylase (regulator of RNase III)
MDNIYIKTGDITKEEVCAIVNAANSSLMGGGGVDGAIHRAGGVEILEACKKVRQEQYPDGLPTGECVATTAGDLPSKYVIHTVGPIYNQCGETCEILLASCYTNALKIADELGCKEIVFPAISTGIYGYPKEKAAKVAYESVKKFLDDKNDMKVIFIFHNFADEELFKRIVEERISPFKQIYLTSIFLVSFSTFFSFGMTTSRTPSSEFASIFSISVSSGSVKLL